MNFDRSDVLPDYREWLDRVESTFTSVTFCCFHRLHDRSLAQAVGLRVVAGLVERPTIFQFSGLPYSGRIGSLAERWISEAKAGRLETTGDWARFRAELLNVPPIHQESFIAVCVWAREDDAIAAASNCDTATARNKRESMLLFFEGLARRAVSPVAAIGTMTHSSGDLA